MGVYIPDMEMPKCCGECRCSGTDVSVSPGGNLRRFAGSGLKPGPVEKRRTSYEAFMAELEVGA